MPSAAPLLVIRGVLCWFQGLRRAENKFRKEHHRVPTWKELNEEYDKMYGSSRPPLFTDEELDMWEEYSTGVKKEDRKPKVRRPFVILWLVGFAIVVGYIILCVFFGINR